MNSLQTHSFVVSHPADDLRALCLVLITSPEGKTTVKLRNHSALAVPYRTALVPEQPQAAMPPMVAPGPGSSCAIASGVLGENIVGDNATTTDREEHLDTLVLQVGVDVLPG